MIPGDTRFSCTLCGDCCTGPQIVRLTGTDLRLLVRHLGLKSVRELKSQGLVSLVRESVGRGRSAWRPRLRFRSRPLQQCPFLVNEVDDQGQYHGLCSLHPHDKPLVCQLSPLTREVADAGSGPVTETWSFVEPVVGCPGVGRGDPVVVAAPEPLKNRLADEVEWMRFLIRESPSCPDEAAAWVLLERWDTAV